MFVYFCFFTMIDYVFSEKIVVCEHNVGTIKCGSNSSIQIETAMFGRMEKSICGVNATTYCHTPGLSVVIGLCEGRETCRLPANKALFGKSCGDIPSYAEVIYKCNFKASPASFVFNNNKAIHFGSSNNLMVAVGILGTLFALAAVTLVVVGVRVWKSRQNYRRPDRNYNDDLDWSLYSSDRDIIQYDFIQNGFNTPIYTGDTTRT